MNGKEKGEVYKNAGEDSIARMPCYIFMEVS